MKKTVLVPAVAVGSLLAAFLLFRGDKESTSPAITVGSCVGYCNLPLLLAAERSGVGGHDKHSVRINLKYIGNPADHAIALLSPNGPIACVTPFTNVIAAYGGGQPVRIIAGSGMNGLALVGRNGIRALDELRGGTVGTYRGDTLEVFGYAALERAGLQGDVDLVSFADPFESLTAVRSGQIDAVTHVEPFVSQLVDEGMVRLASSHTLWQTDHPDCVLVTTEDHIRNHRDELKALITEMALSQQRIEQDLDEVVTRLAEPFYKMQPEQLVVAARSQFPAIDIRGLQAFIVGTSDTMVRMGYVKERADDQLFDFTLLTEVIEDNVALFGTLQKQYAP